MIIRIISNIVLFLVVLVICAVIGVSLFAGPVYQVTTTGQFDPDGDGVLEGFEIKEEYDLKGYKVSSSHEMFDTDDDGIPDSKESLHSLLGPIPRNLLRPNRE